MRRETTTEADLAAVVIAWLEALGADVYQEVELSTQGKRCDIVAVLGTEVWIVETKTSMSLAVLDQCWERRRVATRIYAAVPVGTRTRAGSDLFAELGIGLLSVDPVGETTWTPSGYTHAPLVREVVASRRWNRRPASLRAKLRPEHKTHARAGAPTGGHWSPFRATCEALAREVARSGPSGIALKEAIASIPHHYRSAAGARHSMAAWIREGKVPGVRIEGSALYPVPA